MMRRGLIWTAIIVLLIWNIALSLYVADLDLTNDSETTETTTIIQNEVNGFSTDLTDIVEEIRAAIVTVETDTTSATGTIVRQEEETVYVVTNYHAVESVTDIYLVLDNYQRVEATLVGYDAIRDVAVLSFASGYSITPIVMGDSTLLKAGEFVLAIGSPLGAQYRGSVSFGIVSSAYRILDLTVGSEDYYIGMIQSDITMNSGNSGGPIVNMAGELVGLNTLEVTVDDATGLSFSLTSEELSYIIEAIIEDGTVTKNDLGIAYVSLATMTNYQKSALGILLDQTDGLYITDVKTGFIASSLGIRAGDILLEVDDVAVDGYEDLLAIEYGEGPITRAVVIRDGSVMTLEA